MKVNLAYHAAVAGVIAGAILSGETQAAIIIPVAADTRVINGTSADTNFGSEVTVRMRDRISPDITEKIYFSFDLSSVNLTAPEFVSATLSYKVAGVNAPPPNDPYHTFGVTGSTVWDYNTLSETSITWNNAPNNQTGSTFIGEGSTANDAVRLLNTRNYQAADLGEIKQINVTDFVKWALGLDPSYSNLGSSANLDIATFLMRHNPVSGANSSNVSFHSKQAAVNEYKPILTIETQEVPEPAGLALLSVGCLLGLRRRRS